MIIFANDTTLLAKGADVNENANKLQEATEYNIWTKLNEQKSININFSYIKKL